MELVVALDMPTPEDNLNLVDEFSGSGVDVHFKIGLNTFTAAGPDIVKKIKDAGFKVVLDLKLYDIPNTMAGAATRICELGVDLFTIHASAGEQGMKAVMTAITDFKREHKTDVAPKVLAVTILTSFTHDHCMSVYGIGRSDGTARLVGEATKGLVDGVVCAAPDLPSIDVWQTQILERSAPRPKLIKFVPGIELKPRADDQSRKGTLRDVVLGGADYIVVGRPIYQFDEPVKMAALIKEKVAAIEKAWETIQRLKDWEDPPPA